MQVLHNFQVGHQVRVRHESRVGVDEEKQTVTLTLAVSALCRKK